MSRSSRDARRVLVTAGPTHEPIDDVRYLANRSSGRMGLALAEAAARRGWPVTLLLGPGAPDPTDPSQVRTARFRSTHDLARLLDRLWPEHDLLLMAAAVADYRPRAPRIGAKLPRTDRPLILELEPTPDLVAQAARQRRPDQLVVAFALEAAGRLRDRAREKLRRKGVDAIVANPLETMGAPDVTAELILADGAVLDPPGRLDKAAFADWLLDQVPAIEAARASARPAASP